MNEIIKINTDKTGKQTVNARDLHVFLESKQEFAHWIKAKVLNNPFFQENQDYVLLDNSLMQTGRGGHNRKDYALTIDTGKKVAMAEQTTRGDEVRDYFIECERRAKDPILMLNDPAAMRQILLTYTEKVLALEETVKEQIPKVAAYNRIAVADGSMCVTDAAKHLQIQPRKQLMPYLIQNKWLYRRPGNRSWLGYQVKIQQGLIEHKITTEITGDGVERIYEQARITPKGLTKLAKVFEAALA